MMQLEHFFSADADAFRVSPQQASAFAKEVAGDFNPIHDPDSKRFCVPGDLLFSLVLHRYGLSRKMQFTFSGMVGDGVALRLPESSADALTIADDNGKEYLSIQREGDINTDHGLIRALTQAYVEFSGQTFPHILVPLMAEKAVMINPDRPLVIYESMAIDLDRLDFSDPVLELSKASLDCNGKRGAASLEFTLNAGGEQVGHGRKSMLLSGLRTFEQDKMQQLVDAYAARKESYSA